MEKLRQSIADQMQAALSEIEIIKVNEHDCDFRYDGKDWWCKHGRNATMMKKDSARVNRW